MNELPHIHVTGHGGVAKIWLQPVQLDDSAGIKSNDLKRAILVVEEHNSELLEAWYAFFRDIS